MSHLISKDDFNVISGFIYRKSGILIEKDRHFEKINSFISTRFKLLNIDTFKQYYFKLRFDESNSNEFSVLMSEITINDTYFFREKKQFDVFVNKTLPQLHKTIPIDKTIRILSAPCSSGEEVYSFLLYILEHSDISYQRNIEIIGIDIDSNVIKNAKLGQYSEESVCFVPDEILSKHFKKSNLTYTLFDELKKDVDFQEVNVFDKEKMKSLGKFDVIFSRNMLMYFDDASKKEVSMRFYDMLNSNGTVFLGHTEDISNVVSVFDKKKIDEVYLYKR